MFTAYRKALTPYLLRSPCSFTRSPLFTQQAGFATEQEHSEAKKASAAIAPKRPLNILFFGSSAIAIPVLDALKTAQESPIGESGRDYPLVGALEVVCPAAKRTREKKATILDYAESANLNVHPMSGGTDFRMTNYVMPTESSSTGTPFDLGVVISFGYFIRPDMIDAMPMGMINAHGSLLPKFRGASPIQHALLHGEKQTGITVTTIHPKVIDLGRVLDRSAIDIHPDATYASLVDSLGDVARKSVIDVLTHWDERYANSVDQADLLQREGPLPAHLRHAGKIPSHGPLARAAWQRNSAKEVYNTWRALQGFIPFYTYFKPRPIPDDPKPPSASVMKQRRMILREAVGYARPGTTQFMQYDIATLTDSASTSGDDTNVGHIEVDPTFKSDRSPQGVIRIRCRDGLDALFTAVQFEGEKIMDTTKFGSWLKSNRIALPFVQESPESESAV